MRGFIAFLFKKSANEVRASVSEMRTIEGGLLLTTYRHAVAHHRVVPAAKKSTTHRKRTQSTERQT